MDVGIWQQWEVKARKTVLLNEEAEGTDYLQMAAAQLALLTHDWV